MQVLNFIQHCHYSKLGQVCICMALTHIYQISVAKFEMSLFWGARG